MEVAISGGSEVLTAVPLLKYWSDEIAFEELYFSCSLTSLTELPVAFCFSCLEGVHIVITFLIVNLVNNNTRLVHFPPTV